MEEQPPQTEWYWDKSQIPTPVGSPTHVGPIMSKQKENWQPEREVPDEEVWWMIPGETEKTNFLK